MHSSRAQVEIQNLRGSIRRAFVGTGILLAALLGATAGPAAAANDAKPFLGEWALTIPGGGAGWLGVTEKDGQLQASVLWGGGSVLPVASVKVEGDQLIITRGQQPAKKQAAPGKGGKAPAVPTITARVDGDKMTLIQATGPAGANKTEFSGHRTPPLPPAPQLSKVKFGAPIALFDGKNDLNGWTLTDSKATSAWSVQDGILVNRPVQKEGEPKKHFVNLRTVREFEDFNITLETRLSEGSNSGVYLRGIYEVQVAETYGRPLDPHNMGGVYSRICPTVSAEKPAGQWQTLDITLVDRHVTVILNGTKIIDNQPLLGCTGGALWSDQLRPGPIYLQGDHTGIEYRNIVLKPVVK
jgi:hypothetical protein